MPATGIRYTTLMALVAAVATGSLALAGCGSSSKSAEVKTIESNWKTFFDASTPTSRRVALLQDGSQFASVIKAQEGSAEAKGASAKVSHVTVTSATQAKVTYSIIDDGVTALPHQTGKAIKQDGTWKVGVASFCGLLDLEADGKTSALPAACRATS